MDSTPVECARSLETVKRGGTSSLADALANAADYGYCASHSRFFWGFRLHALFALDGTPQDTRADLAQDRREARLRANGRALRTPARPDADPDRRQELPRQTVRDRPRRARSEIIRPRRKDEPGRGPHLAPIRHRIESIFWTAKDILTLERHGARTLHNLRVRLATRFAALAAAIALNHQLGRPSRSLACYTT